ncbi:MAG TPA: asparagine synthase (glutamine-hydrolyzing) [Pyrinomonadaceae bacterium]|nr:asparagine synthase (glutamine-hydrolyzing) [Pyrinomonadaceae bacterium]
MCAIIGIASQESITDRRWLAAGRDLMQHRGPDDKGEWWAADGRVGFGHRRLAIIDLSAAGHQPMHFNVGDLSITFNGEIYNFEDLRAELADHGAVFRSRSDTEVILAAYREWGTDCLARLNGMFAFALYDAHREQLFIARDRAGEKPLFYSIRNNAVSFSSELKGLLANPVFTPRIDPEALDCYLAAGFVPGARCILREVKKLPPAHALVFDLKNGQSRLWRYWQLPARTGSVEVDESALLDELDALLEDSVRRQLYADVPVGVLLSGGVDSSLVTAMAVRSSNRVKTFTVRFPGHGKHDETVHAQRIAQHFGTEHQELEAEATSVELLGPLARQFDEPMIDSSMIPTYLVSKLIREHCTVALGGDGGDELFGGYSFYDRLLRMQRSFGWIPKYVRKPFARTAGALLPVGFRGRSWMGQLDVDLSAELPLIAWYFDRNLRQRLLVNGRGSWKFPAEAIYRRRTPQTPDLLERAMRMDFETYLAEDILVKVDRASMLNSLEVRAPMLDRRVIEFAFAKIPSCFKASAESRKILLKKLCARLLPPTFDKHRKQGFSIPLDAWLRSEKWRKYFREVLLDRGQKLFDHGVIEALFAGHAAGRSNGERLFGLVLFELWRREYHATL